MRVSARKGLCRLLVRRQHDGKSLSKMPVGVHSAHTANNSKGSQSARELTLLVTSSRAWQA
eukprot:3284613-Pleurochrysis_carterae.AAC.1